MKVDVIHNQDCLKGMKELPDDSIDQVVTDPPYGISFMGKHWDQALPSVDIWREALRVLKPGAFAFVMCIPRQDCLARMIVSLEDTGFNVSFSPIFHTFASGFPKSQNISKAVDKRLGRLTVSNPVFDAIRKWLRELVKERGLAHKEIDRALGNENSHKASHYLGISQPQLPTKEDWDILKKLLGVDVSLRRPPKEEHLQLFEREIVGYREVNKGVAFTSEGPDELPITLPATPQAQALDGSYSYNPKPAVEVVLVCQKRMTHKTYVDQALAWHQQTEEVKQGKREATDIAPGCVNFDECRIPYESEGDKEDRDRVGLRSNNRNLEIVKGGELDTPNPSGRFPANLLASDDALNDGRVSKGSHDQVFITKKDSKFGCSGSQLGSNVGYADSGSFSRYFSLDAWWKKKLEELDKLSSKAYNKEKNKGEMLWETSQAEESPGSKGNDLSVDGVKRNSPTTGATEQGNANFARQNVTQDLGLQSQSRDAKSAERKPGSTEIDIARRLARIKQDMETLLQMLESESTTHTMPKKSTPFSQSVASYATGKLRDLRDIIQISIDQPRLFGSAIPVIIKQMQQDLSQDQLWQNFWQERIKLLPKSQQRTFPFAIISKASKAEKNRGCEGLDSKRKYSDFGLKERVEDGRATNPRTNAEASGTRNVHATVKPIKLMAYLITLGSRPGDIVLDPFLGSGTTAIAARMLRRHYIGYETDPDYCRIAEARLKAVQERLI